MSALGRVVGTLQAAAAPPWRRLSSATRYHDRMPRDNQLLHHAATSKERARIGLGAT